MIKDLVSALDYSSFAEIALGLFVAAFLVMLYGTLRLSRGAPDRFFDSIERQGGGSTR
ncbi:MAG: hypothetical protein R3C05_11580 [Pirellulaceae bacterium]